VFVTLVRHLELVDIGIPNLFEEVEKRGMESIHFPIKDKWVPDSMDQLILLVDAIITRLRQGKTVVVHCNGGKGRSGTVAVAALVGLGRKVEHSIDIVRRSRSGTIRNPLQIAYVKKFKTMWRKRHKEKMAHHVEEEDEIMDPEELAEWKKWEENLLQKVSSDEEKLTIKSPSVEPVLTEETSLENISSSNPTTSSTISSIQNSTPSVNTSSPNNTANSSGLAGNNANKPSPLRNSGNNSPTSRDSKKKDPTMRGSLWSNRKKGENDKKVEKEGQPDRRSKEEIKSDEKRRKQEKQHAKKVEKQQKALEKQKMKVAKENAKLLAAQSPQLAVGASRRASDTPNFVGPQTASELTESSTLNVPGTSNEPATAMATVLEGKEDDEDKNNDENDGDDTTEDGNSELSSEQESS